MKTQYFEYSILEAKTQYLKNDEAKRSQKTEKKEKKSNIINIKADLSGKIIENTGQFIFKYVTKIGKMIRSIEKINSATSQFSKFL